MAYKRKIEKDVMCPLEFGFETFGGKWKSRIICLLNYYKTLRYNQLKKELTNISDTILAQMLKELINDGIIDKMQFNEIPPHVEYSLSNKGKSLHPILKNICKWSKENLEDKLVKKHPACLTCNEPK